MSCRRHESSPSATDAVDRAFALLRTSDHAGAECGAMPDNDCRRQPPYGTAGQTRPLLLFEGKGLWPPRRFRYNAKHDLLRCPTCDNPEGDSSGDFLSIDKINS
jgi:hypothetical protein